MPGVGAEAKASNNGLPGPAAAERCSLIVAKEGRVGEPGGLWPVGLGGVRGEKGNNCEGELMDWIRLRRGRSKPGAGFGVPVELGVRDESDMEGTLALGLRARPLSDLAGLAYRRRGERGLQLSLPCDDAELGLEPWEPCIPARVACTFCRRGTFSGVRKRHSSSNVDHIIQSTTLGLRPTLPWNAPLPS